MQHDFQYVTRREAKPVKENIEKIIYEVQNLVRQDFTFSFQFVGSAARNMITYDRKSNIGYDFDVNIYPNDDEQEYSPKQIKSILMNAINQVAPRYGYDFCENSTRVITIKVKDIFHSKIQHSCDFAIVYDCTDGRQQYIRFNKKDNSYTWEYQNKGFYQLSKRRDWIKKNGLWNDLLDYYIEKKNNNTNSNKHSRSLFAEAINELWTYNQEK